jgi:hypothetical protein
MAPTTMENYLIIWQMIKMDIIILLHLIFNILVHLLIINFKNRENKMERITHFKVRISEDKKLMDYFIGLKVIDNSNMKDLLTKMEISKAKVPYTYILGRLNQQGKG